MSRAWAGERPRASAVCCLLFALFWLVACQAQPAPRLPRAVQRSQPQDQPNPMPPAGASEPEPREDDAIVHEFVDPGRRNKLIATLSDLDTWTQERGRAMNVAGLLVGVVIDDQLVKTASYGVESAATGKPVNEDSVFRIGSITKPFTAMAVLKLRDAGKLELDADAARYLPELSRVKRPSADAARVSVRHLLTHSSGLPREAVSAEDTDGRGTSERALLEALAGVELEFEPGSRYQYSNLGFTLLGMLVARVSGMSYRRYMSEQLFAPLGLDSAEWDAEAVPPEHLAEPHKPDEQGVYRVATPHEPFGAREPSGGLYLSGRDLGRFLSWQLVAHPPGPAASSEVVRRSSRREAQRPGRITGLGVYPAAMGSRWIANAEASSVGLSWHAYKNCDFDHVVFHNGLVHTYASDAAFLPEFGVGVFVLSNSMPSDVGGLRRELLARLGSSGALLPRQRRAARAPRLARALEQLVEVYNAWDPVKYDAMLSEGHKQRITQERERQEFEEYRELHGKCSAGPMLHYTSRNSARYRMSCERAELEMALYLNAENGLIDGFIGFSRGVVPMAGAEQAAERVLGLLGRWDAQRAAALLAPEYNGMAQLEQLARQLTPVLPCRLGELLERDGNRWQRFRVSCARAPERVLSLHLSDDDRTRVDGILLEPKYAGPCAEKP